MPLPVKREELGSQTLPVKGKELNVNSPPVAGEARGGGKIVQLLLKILRNRCKGALRLRPERF